MIVLHHEASPLIPAEEEPPSNISSLEGQWYNYVQVLEERPLLTKTITATILFGVSDLVAQGIEHLLETANTTPLDWLRTARFGTMGFFGAPWSHYYFEWLDQRLPPTDSPWTRTTAVKVLIDQFIQAPILLALMIVSLSLMKGTGWSGVSDSFHSNFVDTMIANWKLWLPASAINFIFIKPSLRVLYVNVVFVFWTVILSLMLNN